MASENVELIDRFYRTWFDRDHDAMAATLSPLVRLTQHFADPALSFTGTSIGKTAFRARLEAIFRDWIFDRAEPRHDRIDGNHIRTNCSFELRHIASGEVFDGTFRHDWRIDGGLITHIDEQIDVARLKAFLRLLEATAPGSDQPPQ